MCCYGENDKALWMKTDKIHIKSSFIEIMKSQKKTGDIYCLGCCGGFFEPRKAFSEKQPQKYVLITDKLSEKNPDE